MDDFDIEEDVVRARYDRAMKRGGRRYPCPTCGEPKRLTLAEKNKGYHCTRCTARAEGLID